MERNTPRIDRMTMNLFEDAAPSKPPSERVGPGAIVLREFALPQEAALLAALSQVVSIAPFRHMTTPGGLRMSVAMSSCGSLGWVSDRTGYRYDAVDSLSALPWPPMPESFVELATLAAHQAGFEHFVPDSCLINRYEPGAKLSLHQDKDERDFSQPIVSVSLGVPAVFLFGGLKRADPAVRIALMHADVVVWGGPDRLRYHGIAPVKEAHHRSFGPHRINLTFRKAA